MRRYSELDALRFIFAIIVVIGHAAGWKNTIPGGYFSVDFFFVLSGFVLAQALTVSERSFKEFAIDRLARLVPLHWLTLLVFVCVLFYAGWQSWFTAWEFLVNALLLQSLTERATTYNWPSWSISVELIVNLVLFYSVASRGRNLIAGIAIIISGLLMLIPSIAPDHWQYLARGVYGLMLGYCSFEAHVRAPEIPQTARTIFLFATGAVVFAIVFHTSTTVSKMAIAPLAAALIFLLASGESFISTIFRPLGYLGLISYSIYLVHAPLIILARSKGYLGLDAQDNFSGEWWQVAVLLVIVVAVSVPLYEFIEKPARKLVTKPINQRRNRIWAGDFISQ
jgi:peptidoglycan/LPS O-acetylase OafA/YrhL